MIYLDNSATTRPYDEVIAKMDHMNRRCFGNPSSVHELGIAAEQEIRAAREAVAAALGCKSGELYFTSGGTEADNLAILGAVQALRRRGSRIVTTDAEHPAVLEPMRELERQGFEVVRLSTKGGAVRPDELLAAIDEKTILCSMMMVNNETGARFPVELARKAIDRAKAPALLHCDCVQSFLKIPFSAQALGADLITISAHKIHGPKGVGALYVRSGKRIVPPYLGGGQERGIRSGTENAPGIAGFGEAARLFCTDKAAHYQHLAALSGYARERLSAIGGLRLNLCPGQAPHILSVTVGTVRSEVVLRFLESRAVYVSAGSACASHKKNSRSHVLSAMGLPPGQIDSTVRVSFSHTNTREEVDALALALEECLASVAGKA